MFTGIVEDVGRVERLERQGEGTRLILRSPLAEKGPRPGDSLAVNGACLTVTEIGEGTLTFGLAPETLSRTNLGSLAPGDGVNLERALPADGRLDGHFVQGHIDGTGRFTERVADGDSLRIGVEAAPELLRYMVPKGYIAVDGTSLTLIDVSAERFTFMLVAYTRQHIALPERPVGALVNIEVDILAKYAEKLLAGR